MPPSEPHIRYALLSAQTDAHVPCLLTASKYGRDYFEATGKKTTNLACTNATKVGEFPIPLPRLEEQEAICTYLEEKLGEVKHGIL